jgi:glucokinase
MCAYSIGVDLGGTNLRVAAIDSEGNLLDRISTAVVHAEGPERVIRDIVSSIELVRNRSGSGSLKGYGIALPGLFDPETGAVAETTNLPSLRAYPIREAISRQLDGPITFANDGNAAALGEMWVGAGRGVKDLMIVTLGTGIGSGIVLGGEIFRGSLGTAAEFGHTTVFPDGHACACGNSGCLEKHASASAITAVAESHPELGAGMTAEQVCKLAISGNLAAREIFSSVGQALGIALANAVNLFNLPLYLLAGGPLPAWHFFAPAMFDELQRRSFVYRKGQTRVDKAALGADAGLFGAAYLAFRRLPVSRSNVVSVSKTGT